tara:strand:- start:3455 stop:3661 length:207 start_codon:yes stop_codon:yes gene_type:complete
LGTRPEISRFHHAKSDAHWQRLEMAKAFHVVLAKAEQLWVTQKQKASAFQNRAFQRGDPVRLTGLSSF